MKRFKNILVVHDLAPGCDQTLQSAIELATRNDARLTIVHAINPAQDGRQIIAERERILNRLIGSLDLPASQKTCLVRHGPPAQEILKDARRIQADLIVTSDISSGFYTKFFGLDTSTELLREADCPVWVVRPAKGRNYRRIIAAVNAGKENALECPANRRILEIGSSLATIEKAEFHVVYAWDYEGAERDMMTSELPPGKYQEHAEMARLRSLGQIVTLVRNILGEGIKYKPLPIRGHPRNVIIDYINEQEADLLIADGKIYSPIKSALIENTAAQLLEQSTCSVLLTRPVLRIMPVRTPKAA